MGWKQYQEFYYTTLHCRIDVKIIRSVTGYDAKCWCFTFHCFSPYGERIKDYLQHIGWVKTAKFVFGEVVTHMSHSFKNESVFVPDYSVLMDDKTPLADWEHYRPPLALDLRERTLDEYVSLFARKRVMLD